MLTRMRMLLLLALTAISVGCGEEETEDGGVDPSTIATPDNTLDAPPSEWLGDTPHLVIMGTLAGYTLDIQLMDLSAPVEGVVPQIGFKREYEQRASDSEIRYTQIEVEMEMLIGGLERAIDFQMANANFDQTELSELFTIVPEANIWEGGVETILVEGQNTGVELGMEWEDEDSEEDVENVAQSGTVSFALLEGTPDADDITRSGSTDRIGGFVNVTTEEGDQLVISFTVYPLPDDDEIVSGVELSAVDNFYE